MNGRAILIPFGRSDRRRPPRRPGRARRRGARRRPGRRHDHRRADLPFLPGRRPGRRRQQALGQRDLRTRRARRRPDHLDRPARTTTQPSIRSGSRPRAGQALGSGFVIDKAGHIVTNYHVIEGADQIEVSFSNQDTLRATLVGSDPSTDIAVLRVEASSRGLTPLAFGDSGGRARRRSGRRDREPLRARPHDHRRHRQRRSGAHDHRAERLPDRPRDPDRRADQQRQLRRPAPERTARR